MTIIGLGIVKSQTPRKVLNELKWKSGFDIKKSKIWYIHRGLPNDIAIITGADICELGRSFFITKTAMIPYHRIIKIFYEGKIIFNRPARDK